MASFLSPVASKRPSEEFCATNSSIRTTVASSGPPAVRGSKFGFRWWSIGVAGARSSVWFTGLRVAIGVLLLDDVGITFPHVLAAGDQMLLRCLDGVSILFQISTQGIVASGLVISLQTWCIHKGGPVCVAVFQPVQTILVVIMASLFLSDQLYSGGILGAILIAIGLYSVLWGKSVEYKMANQDNIHDQLTKHLLPEKKETAHDDDDDLTCEIP